MAFTTTDQHASGMSASRAAAPDARPLHGMKSICAYVGVTEKTVIKLVRQESFPAGKIGGSWESDESEVDRWRLERCKTAASPLA